MVLFRHLFFIQIKDIELNKLNKLFDHLLNALFIHRRANLIYNRAIYGQRGHPLILSFDTCCLGQNSVERTLARFLAGCWNCCSILSSQSLTCFRLSESFCDSVRSRVANAYWKIENKEKWIPRSRYQWTRKSAISILLTSWWFVHLLSAWHHSSSKLIRQPEKCHLNLLSSCAMWLIQLVCHVMVRLIGLSSLLYDLP